MADARDRSGGVVGCWPMNRKGKVTFNGLRDPTLAVVTLAVALGCGADERDSGSIARDSAGVTIVESARPQWSPGEEWQVAREPTVAIGRTEGAEEYQLFRVIAAHRMADGRIVIANWGSQELRFYDETGAYLFAVGKEGGGPGEFRSLGRMWIRGDTLVVMDFQLMRISLFTADGDLVRSFNLTHTSDGILPIPAELFSDGSLLVEHNLRDRNPQSGLRRDSVMLLTYSLDGELIDTIGQFPGDETYYLIERDMITSLPRPFGLESQQDVAGNLLYFGAGDSYEIQVFASDGTLERIMRRPVANAGVTQEEADAYRDRVLERQQRMAPAFRELSRQVELPATKPAYTQILVDSRENVWVAEYPEHDGDRSLWDVFDPEGRWLGKVETPYGGYIYQIGEDFLVGVWVDELDVEQVRLYEIER